MKNKCSGINSKQIFEVKQSWLENDKIVTLVRICAYCVDKILMDEKAEQDGFLTTHGICNFCMEKERKKITGILT